MNDDDHRDPATEAGNAERLRSRIAAVLRRVPKAVPVLRGDGTVLLRGRRRIDREAGAADRRIGERRKP